MGKDWRYYVGMALLAVAVIGVPLTFVYKVLPLLVYGALVAAAAVGAAYLVLGKKRFRRILGGDDDPGRR